MLAAAWPSADQIWRVNAATDVLPLVPVTAAITCGWREKNFAAVSAKARRASSTLMNATPSGSGVAGGRSAITAAAPDATACETKLSPSSFAPATATNRSPRLMARLSALTPARSSAAKRASLTASTVRRSASFMACRDRLLSLARIVQGCGRSARCSHLARSSTPQARIQGRLLGDEYRGPRNGVPATAKARLRASVTRYASRGAPRGDARMLHEAIARRRSPESTCRRAAARSAARARARGRCG